MFIGEFLCLLFFKISEWYQARLQRRRNGGSDGMLDSDIAVDNRAPVSPTKSNSSINENQQSLLLAEHHAGAGNADSTAGGAVEERKIKKPRPPLYYFLIFSLFDMTATILSGIGLLWLDSSLYQMLRGGQVVFAALLSICLLQKRFSLRHIGSLLMVVVGLVIVGLSALLKGPDDDSSSAEDKCKSSSDSTVSSGEVRVRVRVRECDAFCV